MEKSFMDDEKYRIKTIFENHVFLESCKNGFKFEKNDKKNSSYSQLLRHQANKRLLKTPHDVNEHLEIWELYSKSIAVAPNDSADLIESYFDRAKFLRHLKKNSESINDVNKALEIVTLNDRLKIELLLFKAELLKEQKNPDFENFITETLVKLRNLNLDEDTKNSFCKKLADEKSFTSNKTNNESNKEKSNIRNAKLNVDFQKNIPCASTALKLNYDSNFGTHVVSTRKINPGEILVVENLYSTIVSKFYTHCSYCGLVAWNSIPCESCVYAMYCSQKCKNKAWDEYHYFECHIIHKLWNENKEIESIRAMLSVKLVLQALKEYDLNISELKNILKKIDDCQDFCGKGFSKSGVLNSCRRVLSMVTKAEKKSHEDLMKISITSAKATYYLARRTILFGKNFNCDILSNMVNDDVLFIAALISRMYHAALVNQFEISEEVGPMFRIDQTVMNNNLDLGRAIAPFCSFINHACCPNVATIITDDRQIILYSVQSIEENEQICICYGSLCLYCDEYYRNIHLNMIFIDCSCIACKKRWPTILKAPSLQKMKADKQLIKMIKEALLRKGDSILSPDYLALITNCMEEVMKKSLYPSAEFYELIEKLFRIHFVLYGKWVQMPDSC